MDQKTTSAGKELVIVGGVNIDTSVTLEETLSMGVSNPAEFASQLGGVAANVSRATCQQLKTHLLTTAGDPDSTTAGQISTALARAGVSHTLIPSTGPAGHYIAVLDQQGELVLGLVDSGAVEMLTAKSVNEELKKFPTTTHLAFDCNLSSCVIEAITTYRQACFRIALAVSPAKIKRLAIHASSIDLLLGNREEFATLTGLPTQTDAESLTNSILNSGFSSCVMSDGGKALTIAEQSGISHVEVEPLHQTVESVNGAGDALAGGVIVGLCCGLNLQQSVRQFGLPAARNILQGQGVGLA